MTFGFWINTMNDQFKDQDNLTFKVEKYHSNKVSDKNDTLKNESCRD